MLYRPLGKSMIEASIIGLGTHAFGGSLDSKTANWESRGPTGKLDVDRIIKLQTIFQFLNPVVTIRHGHSRNFGKIKKARRDFSANLYNASKSG